MDPMLFWTAAVVIVGVVGGVIKYFSNQLEKRMDELHNTVQDKLDRTEHQLALQRIDRDFDQLRLEENRRADRIESKLDKLIDWAMERK